ncbi:MAG TPA: hypothetical protein VH540_13910 [Ktedonobacterales bacterium]
MGPKQSGKAVGMPAQQLYRQLQFVVNEAIRTLDAAQPDNPANQAEVENLRSLVWSELTGLEAEFGREGGPRTDRIERFFSHLLSKGSHVGQIEALGTALLGGQPPPARPAPESPVAGLHKLHNMLTEIKQQWQQSALPVEEQVPTVPPQRSDWRPSAVEEEDDAPVSSPRPRRPPARASQPRTTRQLSQSTGFLESLGFRRQGRRTLEQWGNEAPRPRVLLSFVVLFVVLGILGSAGIYFGLSANSDAATSGTPLDSPNATVTLEPLPSGTVTATATLSPDAPKLQVKASSIILVPCPSSTLPAGTFIVENAGGQTLNWTAQVNPIGTNKAPVTLDVTGGALFGPIETSSVTVTITAQISSGTGTITITSNASNQTIGYQIFGC